MQPLLHIAADIGSLLLERGETVGISESSSGGLISAALLSVSGASRFYRGGGVIYTPQAFKGLLRLEKADIADMRSSTEPYALLLADTIRQRLRADWGLCETGAAGPIGNAYGDAAGHTCIGLVGGKTGTPVKTSCTLETERSDRVENMHLFAHKALTILKDALQESSTEE